MMKNIAILGSTGSIGTQTLEIVRYNQDLRVTALAAGSHGAADTGVWAKAGLSVGRGKGSPAQDPGGGFGCEGGKRHGGPD